MLPFSPWLFTPFDHEHREPRTFLNFLSSFWFLLFFQIAIKCNNVVNFSHNNLEGTYTQGKRERDKERERRYKFTNTTTITMINRFCMRNKMIWSKWNSSIGLTPFTIHMDIGIGHFIGEKKTKNFYLALLYTYIIKCMWISFTTRWKFICKALNVILRTYSVQEKNEK